MAYNNRRNEGLGGVGLRRNNPTIANNFITGGQLTPHRPAAPLQHPLRPQGFNQNQSNGGGNFRPPQQRMPGPQPPRMPMKPPVQQPQQQQAPLQVPVQQQEPPAQQQQIPLLDKPIKMDEEGVGENETQKKKPFWANKGRISKKEKQRRRNIRLTKILQPKNAVMILSELVKNTSYQVEETIQPIDIMHKVTATVIVDDIPHVGHGRSKMEAKNMAAEIALKHIVQNRRFSSIAKDEEGEDKMDGVEEESTLPWSHVACFALYKLLNSWGEDLRSCPPLQDPNQTAVSINKPAKKIPDNAVDMNPLMLINQMLPHAQFEELERVGNPPAIIFNFKCTIDGQSFHGTGPNKKTAKKMAAFAACHNILNIQYPPDVYQPTA